MLTLLLSRQPVKPMAQGQRPLVHVSVAVLSGESILLVRETKPDVVDLWNLPGGHVERGETIIGAAKRELAEETGLDVALEGLVGVYSGPNSVRFVFVGMAVESQTPKAADDISEVRFVSLAELRSWPDDDLAGPRMLRAILRDVETPVRFPLTQFVDVLGSQERSPA